MHTDTLPLFHLMAQIAQARANCAECGTSEWLARHEERLHKLTKEFMPSGSGFDVGTSIDIDASHGERLTFRTAFHHMDASGGYAGWSDHVVTVTASLCHRAKLSISGRDWNDIKEYIHEAFHQALFRDVARNACAED
jgi:hypothetical protein